MICPLDQFERLAELYRARAQWPPAAKIAVLVDMECLHDVRLVGFLSGILADPAEDDAVRMHALRFFRCGSCGETERRCVVGALEQITRESRSPGMRVYAVLALARFADLEDVQTSLGALMLDQNEALDLRFYAVTTLLKARLTPQCRALLDRFADDIPLGSYARKASA